LSCHPKGEAVISCGPCSIDLEPYSGLSIGKANTLYDALSSAKFVLVVFIGVGKLI